MRRNVIIVLALGLLAAFPFGAVFADTGSSLPGYALDNGDVNGDLERDLGDGIYLLRTLFARGPQPAPLRARRLGLLCRRKPAAWQPGRQGRRRSVWNA